MPEEYVDMDAARAAAEELLNIGGGSDEDAEEVEEQSETVESEASATPDETTESEEEAPAESEEEDFIPRADLESLLEGLEGEPRERVITAYKSFQRLSTKKAQEVSGLLRSFEGIDPTEARQAYDFVQQLGTDPQFALSVHGELTQALTDAGMSPAQASQVAAEAIESKSAEATPDYDLSEFEDNPFVQQLTALQARVDAADRERKEAEERAAFEAHQEALIREVERQDQQIRRDRPELDDEDMQTVYGLAASTQGNLFAALEQYDALKDRLVTSYVASKTAAPKHAAPPRAAASHSETPVEVTSIKQAHELAKERLTQLMANE